MFSHLSQGIQFHCIAYWTGCPLEPVAFSLGECKGLTCAVFICRINGGFRTKKSNPTIWRGLKNSLIIYASLILRQGIQIKFATYCLNRVTFLDRRPLKGNMWSTFVVPNFKKNVIPWWYFKSCWILCVKRNDWGQDQQSPLQYSTLFALRQSGMAVSPGSPYYL